MVEAIHYLGCGRGVVMPAHLDEGLDGKGALSFAAELPNRQFVAQAIASECGEHSNAMTGSWRNGRA
jgi:hypothetical protein